MVQTPENLTRLTGIVRSRDPHPRLPGWDVVRLSVEDAEPVAGMADLLSHHVGESLDVAVRRELLVGATGGVRMSCRAKLTPDGAQCETHPEPEAFSIGPGSP